MVKTILYEVWFKGSKESEVVAVLMRGDLDINKVKLSKVTAKIFGRPLAELVIARPEIVIEKTKAQVGFAGPIGLEGVKIITDESVRPLKNFLCGANKTDYHVLDVNIGRDFPEPEYADLRNAMAGDCCPRCENGKIQKLEIGTKLYTELNQLGLETVLDEREERIGFKLNDADLIGYPYKSELTQTI